MARIRSIKPDFFTSEDIAALPLSARLTFVGLWTYVDDNGVGVDNEMLINAAIWPLEDDHLETLARTREDLATLSREGLVIRYRDSRKRYLFVATWDLHQKVDHPRKPRYPRPDQPGCEPITTCEDTDSGGKLAMISRESREDLAPEQGSGSRDQGAGKDSLKRADVGSDTDPDFTAFWTVYPRCVGKGQARAAWRKAVLTDHEDPKDIIVAAEAYRDQCREQRTEKKYIAHPATWLHGERYNDADGDQDDSPDDDDFWSR